MTSDYELQKLGQFFEATKLSLSCYRHATFNYLALKEDGKFNLLRGRLHLQWTPPHALPPFYNAPKLRAESLKLEESGIGIKDFIESCLGGVMRVPSGELHFPPENNGSHSLWFNDRFSSQANPQSDGILETELEIRGKNMIQSIEYRGLDSELKAGTIPFHGIKELCDEYSLGTISRSEVSVQIVAAPVVAVSPESGVSGTKAKLIILLPDGLNQKDATLGCIVTATKHPTKRISFSGGSFSWRIHEHVQVGEIELEIPSGAIILCVASFAGVAQQQINIVDPLTSQNQSHAIFRAFDKDLEALRALVFDSYGKGKSQEAREFESAIGWLLGMLGFTVTQLGATSKTSEAPDLIATTPDGHVAVVECTTGLLKSENKLAALVDRTEKVRKSLAASGHQHLKVLPIIVTSKTSKEVSIEAGPATKEGIFVITRETLESMVARSAVVNDADSLFVQAETSIRDANDPISLSSLSSFQMNNPTSAW